MYEVLNFVNVIKECEAASGAGTKDAIKAALSKADPIAQRLINEALNPFRVFGVRKYDMPDGGIRGSMAEVDYETFFSTLDKLVARELTGDAARAAVTAAIGLFPIFAHEYIARIFDKDLKAGFSADTFNKIHKNNPIATFEVMLAEKCEDTEDFEQYVTFPCQADFKYDGERTIAVVKADEITYFSRSGKEAVHCRGLFDADLYAWRKHLGYDFVLDGERCSDKGFTDTVNAKKSGNDEAKANLRFRAFFLMPLADWSAQKTTITMRANRDFLKALFSAGPTVEKIILTEGREVRDYQDMMEFCNEAIDLPENAARKIEGLILKNWDSTYQWDRTFAWTKVKRFYDVDARIVGFYPGRPKSRLADTVGGVNCVAFLESGERVEFNVGSGFSDEQRADMKANPQKWLDATHVIKYQEVTRSKSKTVASLRFCTYERSRDDKTVEI
jgi:ATP-dependent DNA ligase